MFGVILLPTFALQAATRHQPENRQKPLSLLEDAGSAKPLIFQCNAAALAAGVHVGMTPSQGLARCASLRLKPRLPVREASAAEVLLEAAFSCSPWVEATAGGVCTVEWRQTKALDYQTEAKRVIAHLARLNLEAKVGVATNPDLALLAARAAKTFLLVTNSRAFLAELPVAALAPSPPLAAILESWGIRTLGALSALPAQDVTRRLGTDGHELWERAGGRKHRLLRLASAPVAFEEGMEFDHEVETLDPLLFVLRRFIGQLVVRLEAIYRVPQELFLRLSFDDKREYHRSFRIPVPTGNVETLFSVLHTHLENFTAPSSVRRLHLAATPARAPSEQFGLFETALRDPNRFSETLARLYALLGSNRAGIASLENTHRPDRFLITAPDFQHLGRDGDEETEREVLPFGLPLLRFRPPLPAYVEVRHRIPVALRSEVASGSLRLTRGPYQLAGGWWEPSAWACEEWDVELLQGGLYRLSHQDTEWFLEGSYE